MEYCLLVLTKHLLLKLFSLVLLTVVSLSFSAFAEENLTSAVDKHSQLIKDVRELSNDQMQGRKAPSPGHVLAKSYITQRYKAHNLQSFSEFEDYEQSFEFGSRKITGTNLLGYIKGTKYPELFFVITAHYDHLGGSGARIYNGANDNASGIAAMLALLSKYSNEVPAYSVMFIATDAEEPGLYGAKHFVNNSPVATDNIILNVNVDMIGDGGRRNTLYALASSKSAKFKQALPKLADFAEGLPLKLRWRKNVRLHHKSLQERIDWRQASDHASFGRIGIPYLYFGADTNNLYHTTKDTFDHLDQEFFIASVTAIIKIADYLQNLKPSELLEDK